MKILRVVALCAVSALAGCAGISAAHEYKLPARSVQMTDDTYSVYEHPKGDRIMVTPSLGTAAKLGLSRNPLVPGEALDIPYAGIEAAARKYLDDTGRTNCQITRRELVMEPQYAFFFTCS